MCVGFIGRLSIGLESIEGNLLVAKILFFGNLVAWLMIILGTNTIYNYFTEKTGKKIITTLEIIFVCCALAYCSML